jgi:hypothetical protein
VSATAAPPTEPTRRAGATAALLAATVLAAAAGAGLGGALGSGGTEPRADDVAPRVGLASGVARLPLPADWQPLGGRSSLAGFDEATAVHGPGFEVALDIRAPEDVSLLPASVRAATPGGLPAPLPRQLDGRTAWRYDLPGARAGTQVVALALPTTGGVVTIACSSSATEIGRVGQECERAAQALQLDGASALAPAPDTAAKILLPSAATLLNRRRILERRKLAATRSPLRRSGAARRLARAYADAAARLRPVAAGDAARLTATLDALAQQHRALASASLRRDPGAARRAGAAIARDERRLIALLAAVTGPAAGS